ncbi:hypothetical protein D3C78_1783750 [compost metagenome]
MVPVAQNPETLGIQPFIPSLIRCALQVLSTVQFHHQHPLETYEIDDVAADGSLSAKLQPKQLTASQVLP